MKVPALEKKYADAICLGLKQIPTDGLNRLLVYTDTPGNKLCLSSSVIEDATGNP